MKQKLNCILLIDDDEPTNFLNGMLLEETNCSEKIQVAQSGKEALDYLTNSEHASVENEKFPCPDLIFLDVNMPAMNGWEFLDKYIGLEKEHKGKVIMVMLTTSLDPNDNIKANEMPDISGFETKPLTVEKLNRILLKYFPQNFPEPITSVPLFYQEELP